MNKYSVEKAHKYSEALRNECNITGWGVMADMLDDLAKRIEADEAAEPVAWRDPTNNDPSQAVTFDKTIAEKWPHKYSQVLFTYPPAQTRVDAAEQAVRWFLGEFGDLNSATACLVWNFALALGNKLAAAEKKYGYTDGWRSPDWMNECRAKLMEHISEGDPRDVTAYCAFLWYHGASTTSTAKPVAQGEAVAYRYRFGESNGCWLDWHYSNTLPRNFVEGDRVQYEPLFNRTPTEQRGDAVAWQINATLTNQGWEPCTRECYEATLRTGRYMGLQAGTEDVEVRELFAAQPHTVPDAMPELQTANWNDGWNACRAAMLTKVMNSNECKTVSDAARLADKTRWPDNEGVFWVPESCYLAAIAEIQHIEALLYPELSAQPQAVPERCVHEWASDPILAAYADRIQANEQQTAHEIEPPMFAISRSMRSYYTRDPEEARQAAFDGAQVREIATDKPTAEPAAQGEAVSLREAAEEALCLLEQLDPGHGMTTQLRGALAAQPRAVPDGWVQVPVYPTDAMLKAGGHVNSEWLNDSAPLGESRFALPMLSVWDAMLAATPSLGEST